jgi:hypothetical protein
MPASAVDPLADSIPVIERTPRSRGRTLREGLLTIVEAVLEPTATSLWLRE